jgi:GNAT superfamily N-acetyltransferase
LSRQQEAALTRVSELTWREATVVDKAYIEQFECTTPPTRMKRPPWHEQHPRKWELSLQREIHTLSLRCNQRRSIQLADDENGLAAVTVAEFETEQDHGVTIIECVAVALRCRGRDLPYADLAIDQAIQWGLNTADVAGFGSVLFTGKTHPENKAGRALVQRNGFGLYRQYPNADWWQQQIYLTG